MNRDTNKNLLNEELKKFKLLSEYAFYEDRGGEDEFETGEELLLGMSEQDEESEEDLDVAADAVSDELGGELGPEDETGDDMEEPIDEPIDEPIEEPIEEPVEEPVEEPIEEPEDDAVELDVTELVQGTEQARASADAANAKMGKLMGMVAKLEGQIDSMSAISSKIDNLEQELEKRAPTPEEKIEMRSLDSYPYNLKLTDFWAQQDGQYDVMDGEGKEEEYVLKQSDVDSSYSDSAIKDSFDNPYEEEEI